MGEMSNMYTDLELVGKAWESCLVLWSDYLIISSRGLTGVCSWNHVFFHSSVNLGKKK